jgi:pimeloyl-ACP methyl ester carboxylesterase
MRRAITGKANRFLRGAFYKPFSGYAGAWQFMRLVRWGRPEDMLAEVPATLAQLQVPTLVFQGSHDVLPAAFAERAASIIPRSERVTLDAGHFIPLERPKEVAACLRDFFRANSAKVVLSRQHRKFKDRKVHAPRTNLVRPEDAEVSSFVGAH